jgi:hypothetical protein
MLSGVGTAMTAALIATPATAYADCGEPGQDPCTGPVPTVDQVTDLLNRLTDPSIPAEDKHDVVTPDFQPNNIGFLDNWWNPLGPGFFPVDFGVTDIHPAPNNTAGATVGVHANGHSTWASPRPIVLINQNGHWLMTLKSGMLLVGEAYRHYEVHAVPVL